MYMLVFMLSFLNIQMNQIFNRKGDKGFRY